MKREKTAGKLFNIVFGTWCFFDIIMRTAFKSKINAFFSNVLWDSSVNVDKWIDIAVLVLLMSIIIFLQRYSYIELFVLAIVTIPIVIGTIKSDNHYLISMLLFVVAARYADISKLIKIYFYILLFMIPFVILMCMGGVLPDYTLHRGGMIRHALGFEHPNRLGMRCFQLMACFCYIKKNNAHAWIKYVFMCVMTFFVYKVPNSQTAYIGIVLLMLVIMIGGLYDRYGINKRRLMRIMAYGATIINVFTVFISFFDPKKNSLYTLIDKFMSHRFWYGYKMHDYYGVTLWGQRIDTIVKDRKYVGVYHQWYLDNAYLSVLLQFGIVVYVIFSLLLVWAVFYYANQNDYTMVAILFTYSVYGIMTTGFYMMSHNIFLLTISSALYMKEGTYDAKKKHRRFRIVWEI